MTRVLALPKYGRLGASSRLRTLQYLPALEAAGLEVDVFPLLGDEYVSGLYRGRIPFLAVLRAYVARIARMLARTRYDVVWFEKELLPWLPGAIEASLTRARSRVVVDYDDAVFHRYACNRSPLVRRLFGRKIDGVMRRASLVLVGNEHLAQYARGAGAVGVEWLPTVVDLDRYAPREAAEPGAPVVLGWIGSPSTAPYLRGIADVVARLAQSHPLRCVAIGARPDQLEGTPFEALPWSEATEAALLRTLDIGVMPLPDGPFERGKCGYKLIQYMACALPVVASPVGANRDIVEQGRNGFLASGADEWRAALHALVADPGLRRRFGEAGRRSVEQCYSLQVHAPRLARLLTGEHGGPAG